MDLERQTGADRLTGDVPIRPAATIILVRDPASDPSVLMGQRGKGAVFMPRKYVFPGGGVDAADETAHFGAALDERSRTLLTRGVTGEVTPEALVAAALRELEEETGLVLRPSNVPSLRFFLRAITPPGRPRRFDARFFIAPAEVLEGGANAQFADTQELSDLQWVRLANLGDLDIAPVTRMVLEFLSDHLPSMETPERVPLVRRDRIEDEVVWLS